jgi:multiple antibiotic resistance protein
MSSELAITAFATLFVAIGPIDTAIVFGGLTAGVHRPERFRLAWQAVTVAGVIAIRRGFIVACPYEVVRFLS